MKRKSSGAALARVPRAPHLPERPYVAPGRQAAADETRRKIVDAARVLFLARGLDATTIDAIADDAGVSSQTVYSAFGSKRGIVAELLRRARFGPAYQANVERVRAAVDGEMRLRTVASVARSVHDGERVEMELLRGAGALSPELADIERGKESARYEAQAPAIESLVAEESLKRSLKPEIARDILWTLTGRDTYRLLVVERGWTADDYEKWLGETLIAALLRRSKKSKG